MPSSATSREILLRRAAGRWAVQKAGYISGQIALCGVSTPQEGARAIVARCHSVRNSGKKHIQGGLDNRGNREGFHLQNVSLEALAYVYENTFVSRELRQAYGTHATPPEVAEFVVRQLPFEAISDRDQRTVFEPFAGHAPFLTAALGRLRALLPSSVGVDARHKYLVRMLSGIELDSFACEIAWHSLILADYPNPNG